MMFITHSSYPRRATAKILLSLGNPQYNTVKTCVLFANSLFHHFGNILTSENRSVTCCLISCFAPAAQVVDDDTTQKLKVLVSLPLAPNWRSSTFPIRVKGVFTRLLVFNDWRSKPKSLTHTCLVIHERDFKGRGISANGVCPFEQMDVTNPQKYLGSGRPRTIAMSSP